MRTVQLPERPAEATVQRPFVTLDGNEACARVAHKLSEVIAIYPITPSSAMGEWADHWSADGSPNLWGTVPLVVEMQSEAVKLSPFYSNVAALAQQLVEVGANGLVLFNRFNQPDIDLDALEVLPHPLISRSGDGEALRLPLRWIAILSDQLPVDFAATGGVHTAEDALKLLMVGADVTMMASELLLNGVERLSDIRHDLAAWLIEREYDSVSQLQGSMSHRKVAEPSAFERAQYVRTVGTFSLAGTRA